MSMMRLHSLKKMKSYSSQSRALQLFVRTFQTKKELKAFKNLAQGSIFCLFGNRARSGMGTLVQ